MSTPLRHTTKLKVALPVAYLFGVFVFFVTASFLIDSRPSHIIGALITFISCIFWIIARIQLGDAPAEHRLVTTGLYGEMRHPIYVFSTTALVGIAIFMMISELWIAVTAVSVFQIVRSIREERILVWTLGRRYDRYRKRTLF